MLNLEDIQEENLENLGAFSLVPCNFKFANFEYHAIQFERRDDSRVHKPSKAPSEKIYEDDSIDLLMILDEKSEDLIPLHLGNPKLEEILAKDMSNKLMPNQLKPKYEDPQIDSKLYLSKDKIARTEDSYMMVKKVQIHNPILDNMDGQSVITGKSDSSFRKMDLLFDELQKKLKFYKFYHSHFLFAVFIVFLTLFATAVFVSYLNGASSSSEVGSRINLLVSFSQRDKLVYELGRTLWLDHYINLYLLNVLPPSSVSQSLGANQINGLKNVENLTIVNNQIKKIIDNIIDNDMTQMFHQKDIKIFYGDYSNILQTDKYILHSTLQACDQLAVQLGYFIKRIRKSPKAIDERRELLYVNIYNDFIIKSEKTPDIIQKSIEQILQDINNTTQVIYIVCFIFLGIYILTLFYVMSVYFVDTAIFLALFANHSSGDLTNRIKNIEKIKTSITGDSKNDFELAQFDDFVVIEDSKYTQKHCKKSRLLFQIFIKRILIMTLLIIPSIVLVALTYRYPFDNYDYISQKIDNIVKISRLRSKSLIIYHQNVVNELHLT